MENLVECKTPWSAILRNDFQQEKISLASHKVDSLERYYPASFQMGSNMAFYHNTEGV